MENYMKNYNRITSISLILFLSGMIISITNLKKVNHISIGISLLLITFGYFSGLDSRDYYWKYQIQNKTKKFMEVIEDGKNRRK